MADEVPKWHRLENESAKAYDAFCSYYVLPPQHRSIAEAWRQTAAKARQERVREKPPRHWADWSSAHSWVDRALAHDVYLAEQDRLMWEERRRQLREADWNEPQQVRSIVMEALPEASRFVLRSERFVRGADGAPDQLIVTESFNITGLAMVLEKASKLQRLATDEPTEHTKLSGAALDAYITAQLARLAHGGEAGIGAALGDDAAETDSETDADVGSL